MMIRPLMVHETFQSIHYLPSVFFIYLAALIAIIQVIETKTKATMELYYPISSSWPHFMYSSFLFRPNYSLNYVHWTETPESHIYTAQLPGVRKEDIRVEVEDSLYLVIRTEWTDTENNNSARRDRSFMRKFRLPELINSDRITAKYEDGVLTVTVPRSVTRRNLRLNAEDLGNENNSVAPAA